jgi:hypothetical protein
MAIKQSDRKAAAGGKARAFRYRTCVLVGPWRATSDRALADALAARQARIEEDGFRWIVAGQVEEAAA